MPRLAMLAWATARLGCFQGQVLRVVAKETKRRESLTSQARAFFVSKEVHAAGCQRAGVVLRSEQRGWSECLLDTTTRTRFEDQA